MAILKSVVDVNNGNTGWTKSDVLDALETVFANLGWNNGTAASGVPCVIYPPNSTTYSSTEGQYREIGSGRNSGFQDCGGPAVTPASYKTHRYIVKNNGTSAYRMLEEFRINGATDVGTNGADQIEEIRHGISTGDALHYAAGISSPDAAQVIGGLSADTIYYAIKVDDDNFKVAANATDAGNGTAISITAASTTGYYFQRADDAAWDNYTITMKYGDRIYFDSSGATGAGGTFNIIYNSDSYDAAKLLEEVEGNHGGYQNVPTNNASDGSVTTYWNTQGYRQTEDEALRPLRWQGEGDGTSVGDHGIVKYIYANSTNASMKGEIVVEPFISNQGIAGFNPYWKYTVPASGGRSELKLRVYRGNQWYDSPYITAITINSIGSGWTEDEVFTIPGEAIGGVATTNDVAFGVNTDETSSGANDGICSIKVTNIGAGSDLFQKHSNGSFGIVKIQHDAAKAFGTTYYGFGMASSNSYQFTLTNGSNWNYLNVPGPNNNNSSTDTVDWGTYAGEVGLDYQSSHSYVRNNSGTDSYWRMMNYASSSTPTAYPLAIRVYRAQAPQDTDFAVIQFTQTINSIVQPYATFTISKGSQHGAGVYDLDYVYQDTVTEYEKYTSTNRAITFRYDSCSYYRYGSASEPGGSNTKMRAASYGYLRSGENNTSNPDLITVFGSNVDTNNTSANEVMTYYRNNTYDKYSFFTNFTNTEVQTNRMSSSADYYKPIKGLPICNALLPVPYYLPDDFVMLQVATTPGLTAFRTGDTITVSGSEVYEIILASYQSQQNGLDNVDSNSTIGMVFMARTT